jgi:UMF1 family MFS transporter
MEQLIKNDPKTITGWAMYDWANSVYSLVITSTIFPVYYNSATRAAFGSDVISFFGWKLSNTELYAYAISLSFLIVAFLSPLLSGIADYSGSKKSFMKFFAYLGSISCCALYFFTGKNVEYGLACSVLASIGFAGSLVFYNAFLPEIATEDQFDKVSAKGFSLGYIGSVILMIFNLAMIMKPGWFGISDVTTASKISFVTVGLWWAGFSQITFARLPNGISRIEKGHYLSKGFNELVLVWNKLKELPETKRFLTAYFFSNMGVQTVMYLAATFGEKELHLESSYLIGAILVIQLVAIAGAQLFAKVSEKRGNVFSLCIMMVIWACICAGAYFVTGPKMFFILAFVVGMVMGGIQSLCRSTYSKLLPPTKDHASFFSFYDVLEKIGIVLGTALFGIMEAITGSMRNSLWPLMVFFIIAFFIVRKVKIVKN